MDNFKKALENVMQKDIGRFEGGEEHEFSAEFERKMAGLSARFDYSKGKARHKPRVGRIIAAAAAAVILFAVGAFAGAASAGGFTKTREVREDYSLGLPVNVFKAADTENSPKALETIYTLDGISEELASRHINAEKTVVRTTYLPADRSEMFNDELYFHRTIYLTQSTKAAFERAYREADYVMYKELTIDGKQAYFITRERYYGQSSSLIWETDEYIFELQSEWMSEERALELANSLIVLDGVIGEE